MVLLTMTPSIVDLLNGSDTAPTSSPSPSSEPSLSHPAVGNPISHDQILHLWKSLASQTTAPSLEQLLHGCQVYIPPPPPKPQQSEEYKSLMARLRHAQDQLNYDRMLNPPSPFKSINPPSTADTGDDDVTVHDVHRQVTLIINFLVSIAGVAATLWIAARWWALPARLFLTLGGSAAVAVAEVAVYSAYMWRMERAKQRQEAAREVKYVVKTWVVGKDDDDHDSDEKTVLINDDRLAKQDADGLRKRIVAHEGVS